MLDGREDGRDGVAEVQSCGSIVSNQRRCYAADRTRSEYTTRQRKVYRGESRTKSAASHVLLEMEVGVESVIAQRSKENDEKEGKKSVLKLVSTASAGKGLIVLVVVSRAGLR